MSRARAITSRIETIIAGLTPETPLSAPRFRYASGAPGVELQLRQFHVAPTGDITWFQVHPQDDAGIVAEGFSVVVAYPASHPDRRLRDVVREDVLAIQYALLLPDNWDDAETRSELRTVSGYSVEFTAENEQITGLEVSIPVTVRYRPF